MAEPSHGRAERSLGAAAEASGSPSPFEQRRARRKKRLARRLDRLHLRRLPKGAAAAKLLKRHRIGAAPMTNDAYRPRGWSRDPQVEEGFDAHSLEGSLEEEESFDGPGDAAYARGPDTAERLRTSRDDDGDGEGDGDELEEGIDTESITVVADRHGNITYLRQELFRNFLGYTQAELKGKNVWTDVLHPDARWRRTRGTTHEGGGHRTGTPD